jgi:hypothetical protein
VHRVGGRRWAGRRRHLRLALFRTRGERARGAFQRPTDRQAGRVGVFSAEREVCVKAKAGEPGETPPLCGQLLLAFLFCFERLPHTASNRPASERERDARTPFGPLFLLPARTRTNATHAPTMKVRRARQARSSRETGREQAGSPPSRAAFSSFPRARCLLAIGARFSHAPPAPAHSSHTHRSPSSGANSRTTSTSTRPCRRPSLKASSSR